MNDIEFEKVLEELKEIDILGAIKDLTNSQKIKALTQISWLMQLKIQELAK